MALELVQLGFDAAVSGDSGANQLKPSGGFSFVNDPAVRAAGRSFTAPRPAFGRGVCCFPIG
jgi:hypothetical protein